MKKTGSITNKPKTPKFLSRKVHKSKLDADVIIIGAGASGLAAAKNLVEQNKNINVIVLEARNRIGGRIYDTNISKFGKLPIGAAWLHKKGKKQILEPMLNELSIKYMNLDSLKNGKAMNIYKQNGELLSKTEDKKFKQTLSSLPKKIREYGAKSKISIAEAVQHLTKPQQFSQDIINALITRATEHCSLDSDIMPASEFDGWDPNGKVVIDGFQKLVNHLSEGVNIILNSIVESIIQNNSCITIKTQNKIYKSKYIICTLPLGVLKSNLVKFVPELPKLKKKAIKNMFSGSHEKIFLLFDKVFWDPKVYAFQYSDSKNRGLCTQWFNILLPTKGRKVLYTNLSGPDIKHISKSDKQLTKICMKNLKKMFGDQIPNPTAVYVSRWSQDPFTMGGPHSHPNMNGKITDHDIIGKPFRKIYFAGVDTSSSETETVEAALLSGIRVSNEIIFKLNN